MFIEKHCLAPSRVFDGTEVKSIIVPTDCTGPYVHGMQCTGSCGAGFKASADPVWTCDTKDDPVWTLDNGCDGE